MDEAGTHAGRTGSNGPGSKEEVSAVLLQIERIPFRDFHSLAGNQACLGVTGSSRAVRSMCLVYVCVCAP